MTDLKSEMNIPKHWRVRRPEALPHDACPGSDVDNPRRFLNLPDEVPEWKMLSVWQQNSMQNTL
jgi:hypothetical protein